MSFRAAHLLLPGISAPAWRFGGRLIAETFAALLDRRVPTRILTYRDREEGVPFLEDVLQAEDGAGRDDLFVVTWGPHVEELIERLAGRRVVYYAQSTGWKLRLPESVPVLCLSRYILAYWMLHAPHNPLFLLGPVLDPGCRDLGMERDLDILFVERKSTAYLRDVLVPALHERWNVHVVRDFLPRAELIRLYNRARVYLYSSAPTDSGWLEGFGFQPLEALVCGCTVFSNLHGGLSDYLDPEVNAFKIETYSLDYDLDRIGRAVRGELRGAVDRKELAQRYSEEAFEKRIDRFLPALELFFARAESSMPDIQALVAPFPPPHPWWRRLFSSARRQLRHW